jgi:hypothetical protein
MFHHRITVHTHICLCHHPNRPSLSPSLHSHTLTYSHTCACRHVMCTLCIAYTYHIKSNHQCIVVSMYASTNVYLSIISRSHHSRLRRVSPHECLWLRLIRARATSCFNDELDLSLFLILEFQADLLWLNATCTPSEDDCDTLARTEEICR